MGYSTTMIEDGMVDNPLSCGPNLNNSEFPFSMWETIRYILSLAAASRSFWKLYDLPAFGIPSALVKVSSLELCALKLVFVNTLR
jgi:hypothetical protein